MKNRVAYRKKCNSQFINPLSAAIRFPRYNILLVYVLQSKIFHLFVCQTVALMAAIFVSLVRVVKVYIIQFV